MKSARQEKILEIIGKKNIETQNQLMAELEREGVKSTQATLSRDIRDLHLVKELSPEGNYRYAAGGKEGLFDHNSRLKKIFRESVTAFVFRGVVLEVDVGNVFLFIFFHDGFLRFSLRFRPGNAILFF